MNNNSAASTYRQHCTARPIAPAPPPHAVPTTAVAITFTSDDTDPTLASSALRDVRS